MISIKHLKRSIRGGKISPHFLEPSDKETREKALKLVEYYDSLLGRKYSEFSEEKMIEIIGDYKLARAFQSVLNSFYSFKTIPFNEAVTLDNDAMRSYSDLRLFVFRLLEKGFCQNMEEKEKVYEEASQKLGAGIDFDNILWLDHPDNRVLHKEKSFHIDGLIRLYNAEALTTVFLNSVEVSFKLRFFDKKIFWICKQNRLLFDISKSEEGYDLKVFGPVELFGKPAKYGYRISHAVPKLIGYAEEISAFLEVKNKKLSFSISAERYDKLTGGKLISEEVEEADSFDSIPEQKLYESFNSIDCHNWELVREPGPIIQDKTVFVPDFAFKRGNSYVFLEVVGFWTEQYVNKKLDKLSGLKDSNIILLVSDSYDLNVKKRFESLSVPILFFNVSKGVPVLKILKLLEEEFSDFEKRFEGKKEASIIVNSLRERLILKGFILDDELEGLFGSYSHEEFQKYLEFYKKGFDASWVYVPSAGIFTEQKLEEFKKLIEPCIGKDKVFLKSERPEITDTLIKFLGYDIRWKSLNETEIVKSTNTFLK
ncbi:DUF790 family protein [Candidatus Woesearchaeota archaeon]|nr:DUF790 family protein [Candidatus Woesearchaeota archaeon]